MSASDPSPSFACLWSLPQSSLLRSGPGNIGEALPRAALALIAGAGLHRTAIGVAPALPSVLPPLSPAAPGWRRLGIKAKGLRAYMAGGIYHVKAATETRVLAREQAPPANSMRSQAASEAEALQD